MYPSLLVRAQELRTWSPFCTVVHYLSTCLFTQCFRDYIFLIRIYLMSTKVRHSDISTIFAAWHVLST